MITYCLNKRVLFSIYIRGAKLGFISAGNTPGQGKLPVFTSSFNGTGRIQVRPRPANVGKPAKPAAPQQVILNPLRSQSNDDSAVKSNRLTVNMSPLGQDLWFGRQTPNPPTPVGLRRSTSTEKTRSRSVGPTGLPPPAEVSVRFLMLTWQLVRPHRFFRVK